MRDSFASIDTVGGSQNAYLGSGTWGFNTATGGPEEVVAGPASQGPNAVVQHGVRFDGDKFNVPFSTTLGSLAVNPTSIDETAADDGTGTFDVTVESSLDLTGLSADAFGLSQPESVHVNPTAGRLSPSPTRARRASRSVRSRSATMPRGRRSRSRISLPDEDIDLFVVYDANNDGQFTNGEIVGSSTGPAGQNESVTLIDPAAGNYQVWVYGFQVSAGDNATGNTVGIDIVQGNDIVIDEPAERAARREHALHAAPQLQRRRRPRRLRGRAAARPDHRSVCGDGADHDPSAGDARGDAGDDNGTGSTSTGSTATGSTTTGSTTTGSTTTGSTTTSSNKKK